MFDELFVDVATKGVPAIPAHRGCARKFAYSSKRAAPKFCSCLK